MGGFDDIDRGISESDGWKHICLIKRKSENAILLFFKVNRINVMVL